LFIPTQEAILGISPTDFEKYALELLQQQTCGLEKVKIVHNKIIKAYDGNYQLDGYIEFEAIGVMYKTIVECKHYKKAISREIVQKLYDNLRALGAQKGILISTSNFQSGAIEYAKIHGIALIQLVEAGEQYCCRGKFNVIINRPYVPYNAGCPYIGVLQRKSDIAGITCSFLSNGSNALKEFIVTIE